MRINPELVSRAPTHVLRGYLVKVMKTRAGGQIAEFLEGPDRGKWTNDLTGLGGLDDYPRCEYCGELLSDYHRCAGTEAESREAARVWG
jgi:hypothetical protein